MKINTYFRKQGNANFDRDLPQLSPILECGGPSLSVPSEGDRNDYYRVSIYFVQWEKLDVSNGIHYCLGYFDFKNII